MYYSTHFETTILATCKCKNNLKLSMIRNHSDKSSHTEKLASFYGFFNASLTTQTTRLTGHLLPNTTQKQCWFDEYFSLPENNNSKKTGLLNSHVNSSMRVLLNRQEKKNFQLFSRHFASLRLKTSFVFRFTAVNDPLGKNNQHSPSGLAFQGGMLRTLSPYFSFEVIR